MARVLSSQHRLNNIALARQQVLEHGADIATPLVDDWIQRSWRRCMSWGQQPQHGVHFETVSQAHSRRLQEQHQPLLRAAQAELDRLSRAISGTRYFALLTNAQGVVVFRSYGSITYAGMLDLIYANAPFAARVTDTWIDRNERKGKGASDHAPVVVDLADGAGA